MNKPPSVTKSMNGNLWPLLEPLGFIKQKKGLYSRIINCIYQHVGYKVETRLNREFIIEYGVDYLCVPHEFPTLSFGGAFPKRWYDARSEDSLQRSIEEISEHTRSFLLNWLKVTSSASGYYETYRYHLDRTGYNPAGHSDFTLACLCAKLGKHEQAQQHATAARSLFSKAYADASSRDWAKVHMNYANELVEALQNKAVEPLLAEWLSFSISSMKLN